MPACPTSFCPKCQAGMTLIEVLVAMLMLTVGLLGAAVVQLNALKYTDSARMISQASFIAYDLLDRMRANVGADYAWARTEYAPPASSSASVRDLDLHDFDANIVAFAGESAKGAVTLRGSEVIVSISWDDARGSNVSGARQTFSLASRITGDADVAP